MLPPRYQQVIAALILVAGIFFLVMGRKTLLNGRALVARGVVVDAELTAATHRDSDSDTGHQVRYRFRVGDREYQRVGIFGTPVGADVTASVQASAIVSGSIQIRYLAEDPTVNEPVPHTRPQGDRGVLAIGLGVLMMISGLVGFVNAKKSEGWPPDGE